MFILIGTFFIANTTLNYASNVNIIYNINSLHAGYGQAIGATSNNYNVSQTFKAQTNGYLTSVLIELETVDNGAGSHAEGYLNLGVYNCSSDGKPDMNSLIEQSSDFQYAISSSNGQLINLDFSFSGLNLLTLNTNYSVIIFCDYIYVANPTDYFIAACASSGISSGQNWYYTGSSWQPNSFGGSYTNFYVIGDSDVTPTPTPSPTPTPTPTTRYGWTITPNVTFNLYNWGLKSNLVQGQGYTYTGNIISNSTPYGDGNYSYYTTGVKNNLNDAVTDLLAKTVNFNATGTYNINYAGTFSFYITPQYVQGSGNTYQGYLVNGTIRQTGETFESITVIDASEPTNDIRIYLTGGTFVNHELLTTVNFNQVNFGVTYTANGRLFLGSLLTGNYTYYLATTILTSSQLTAKNELFTNVSFGNVQNGIFQFVLSPRTYSSFPLYQGLQITINGTQKTFWLEFIGTVNGLFSSNPATANPNEFGGGMSAQMIQWLIMMLLMFIPVLGVTLFVAIHTHSGSATALTFFGATLIDVVIGVLIGFIDWWVIIIVGVFLIIAAYAQFGKVTTGG